MQYAHDAAGTPTPAAADRRRAPQTHEAKAGPAASSPPAYRGPRASAHCRHQRGRPSGSRQKCRKITSTTHKGVQGYRPLHSLGVVFFSFFNCVLPMWSAHAPHTQSFTHTRIHFLMHAFIFSFMPCAGAGLVVLPPAPAPAPGPWAGWCAGRGWPRSTCRRTPA